MANRKSYYPDLEFQVTVDNISPRERLHEINFNKYSVFPRTNVRKAKGGFVGQVIVEILAEHPNCNIWVQGLPEDFIDGIPEQLDFEAYNGTREEYLDLVEAEIKDLIEQGTITHVLKYYSVLNIEIWL